MIYLIYILHIFHTFSTISLPFLMLSVSFILSSYTHTSSVCHMQLLACRLWRFPEDMTWLYFTLDVFHPICIRWFHILPVQGWLKFDKYADAKNASCINRSTANHSNSHSFAGPLNVNFNDDSFILPLSCKFQGNTRWAQLFRWLCRNLECQHAEVVFA